MGPVRRSAAPDPGDRVHTALVIVRAASGRPRAAGVAITSATLAAHAPSPDDVAAVRAVFADEGFTLGPFVGISFAITAAPATFERVFAVRLRAARDGGITVMRARESFGHDLPLDHLRTPVRDRVEAVTFAPPVELHAPSIME